MMNNTDKKAEKYAKKSGMEFISVARKSDEQNSELPEELKAINRLAAILGVWVNEPWTNESYHFYQFYDSPCTHRMLMCSIDIQTTCDKLSYVGKGDFACEIKEHWQRIKDSADTADENISVLHSQYKQGGIDKKVIAQKVKCEAYQPRLVAGSLLARLKLISRAYSGKKPAGKEQEASGKAGDDKKSTEKIKGEWSKPMSKVDIMKRLGFGLRGYRKLDTYTKEHPIMPVGGNRQLWQIRIDKMPINLQKKFT